MPTEDTRKINFKRRYIGNGVVVKVMPESLFDFICEVKLNGFYTNEITIMDNAEYYLIKVFEHESMIGQAYRLTTVVRYMYKESEIPNSSKLITNNLKDASNGIFYTYMGCNNE